MVTRVILRIVAFCFAGLALNTTANEKCVDSTIKPIERLVLKVETGSSKSTEEKACKKLLEAKDNYGTRDSNYLRERLSDDLFRNIPEILEITSGTDMSSAVTNISIRPETFKTRNQKVNDSPIFTVKGYSSIVGED
mgnify:CR=1 FL=1